MCVREKCSSLTALQLFQKQPWFLTKISSFVITPVTGVSNTTVCFVTNSLTLEKQQELVDKMNVYISEQRNKYNSLRQILTDNDSLILNTIITYKNRE